MAQPKRTKEADALLSAVRQLSAVLPKLNAASKTCPTCSRRQDVNFTDAELARQLARIRSELARAAEVLAEGKDLLVERKLKRDGRR